MKKFIISFCYILLPVVVFAQQQNEVLFSEANEAYNKGSYAKAIELYEKIEKTGSVSENLYFNLANSYYKQQQIAPSIYNYEKALTLAPNDKEIKTNYGFAKKMRIDVINPLPKGFLQKMRIKFVTLFSVTTWAWITIVFMLLFVITFILFYRAATSEQRKLFFGIWTVSLLLCIISIVGAFTTENYEENTAYAIVFSEQSNIQSEPNLRSETLYKLHEGTKVKVLEKVDNWKKIQLADGRKGWIPKKEIKEI